MAFVPSIDRVRDPAVQGWILDQIEDARETGREERAAELEALLDPGTVRGILEGPDDNRAHVAMRALDRSLLAPHVGVLLEALRSGTPAGRSFAAAWAAAGLAPERAVEIAEEILSSAAGMQDVTRRFAALGVLDAAGPASEEAVRRLVARLPRPEPGAPPDAFAWNRALTLAARFRLDETASLLAEFLRFDLESPDGEDEPGDDEDEIPFDDDDAVDEAVQEVEDCLEWTGAEVLGRRTVATFLRVAGTETSFADLAPLYEPDAPLREIDRLASLPFADAAERLTGALLLLDASDPGRPPIVFASRLAACVGDRRTLPDPTVDALACFVLACVLDGWARPRAACRDLTVARLTDLLAADVEDLPGEDDIVAALEARAAGEVADALVDAIPCADDAGLFRLVRVAEAVRDPRLVPVLVDSLDEFHDDDTLRDRVARALCRFGPAAEADLLERWDELDYRQRIWGWGVLEAIGGPRTIDHLLDTFKDMRAELIDIESWTEGALAFVDPRFLDLVEGEVRRCQPEIDNPFTTFCALLGVERPGLAEARARLAGIEASFPPLGEELRGPLDRPAATIVSRCEACGDENRCDFGQVFVGSRSGLRLDPAVPCPSCGRAGRLVPAPMMRDMLWREVIRIRCDVDAGRPYAGPLRFVEDPPEPPFVRRVKIGHNDPCPCGSGRKYKKCCLLKTN